jgi:competence ComEA-like helix-hairpin-helix protein
MSITKLTKKLGGILAVGALVAAMGGTWATSSTAAAAPPLPTTQPAAGSAKPTGADDDPHPAKKSNHKELAGKLNLNSATEDQLMLLPTVGPSKAERIVAWRKKNGGFKRVADLRHVKGFGYRTFKKLEPFLDIKGDTTLAAK